MQPVIVRDNNIERALRTFKRANQRNGLGRELRRKRAYVKPSEKRQQKKAEAMRRLRKNLQRRMLREGY